MAESWYPTAVRRPGPPQKVWDAANAQQGVVCHSMVGSTQAAFGELDNPEREASWHFSVSKSGAVHQHYPLEKSTWHCGSQHWNTRLVGIEHEGGPEGNVSEPLTQAQLAASVALVQWIAEQGRWTPTRDPASRTLHEHNEVGDEPTACPSDRIPWEEYIADETDETDEKIPLARRGDRDRG